MLEIHPVNLAQAAGLTLALFGWYLLKDYTHYATVRLLLLFSGLSAITNFSEEVLGSRDWYLVSPVFIVGVGPMFYLTAVSLVSAPISKSSFAQSLLTRNVWLYRLFHLMPMLLTLPLTHMPQAVIAFGTISFAAYGAAIFKLIGKFELRINAQRSDSYELSLRWFMGLLYVVAITYIVDLTRLNVQQQIGLFWNLTGQLLATISVYLSLGFLIKKLLQFNELFLSFTKEQTTLEVVENSIKDEKSDSDKTEYEGLFQYIDAQIKTQQLYRQPRLSLLQLAGETGLQTRDISRAINLCAQINFNDYINQHRVMAVKQALADNPDTALLDIGLICGFNSKTSFNNVFKRLTGMTPGQFRSGS